MKLRLTAAATAIALAAISQSGFAASDYLLKLEGVEGVTPGTIEVHSWSWGASNPTSVGSSGMSSGRVSNAPRDAASGMATGRRTHLPFSTLHAQSEISSFSISLDGATPQAVALCARGKHIPQAILTARGEDYELTDAYVGSCDASSGGAAARGGGTRTGWDLATNKGARTAAPPPACVSGACPAQMVTLTITGSLKHTKTGHVTLLK